MWLGLLAVAVLLLVPGVAEAATIRVTSADDTGPGTLRAALAAAQDGDTIVLPEATITLASQLTVEDSVTIRGTGPALSAVSGGGDVRLFAVSGPRDVVIEDVALVDGRVAGFGATVQQDGGGSLTLRRAVVRGHQAGAGALSLVDAGLTIEDSRFADLTAATMGDLIVVEGPGVTIRRSTFRDVRSRIGMNVGTNLLLEDVELSGHDLVNGPVVQLSTSAESTRDLTLRRTTIAGNRITADTSLARGAVARGGAGGGTTVVEATTIHDNLVTASAGFAATGGALSGGGPLTIRDSTITSNRLSTERLDSSGGAIHWSGAQVTIARSVLHGNEAPLGRTCALGGGGAPTQHGGSIFDDDTCTPGPQDRVLADPLLAPLGAFGGLVPTRQPLPGSPALDSAGTGCAGMLDARGLPRPSGSACDAGAVELEAAPPTPPPGGSPPTPPPGGSPPPPPPAPPEPLLLRCEGLEVRLVDVVPVGRRVRVAGLALTRFAGETVVLRSRGRTVGRARVRADGTFGAIIARPRGGDPAFTATVAGVRSRPLRVNRRLLVGRQRRVARGVRISGRLISSRPGRRALRIRRQVDCGSVRAAGRVQTDRRGRFAVTLPRPTGGDTLAVYRLMTTTGGRTFTLPVVVRR